MFLYDAFFFFFFLAGDAITASVTGSAVGVGPSVFIVEDTVSVALSIFDAKEATGAGDSEDAHLIGAVELTAASGDALFGSSNATVASSFGRTKAQHLEQQSPVALFPYSIEKKARRYGEIEIQKED